MFYKKNIYYYIIIITDIHTSNTRWKESTYNIHISVVCYCIYV